MNRPRRRDRGIRWRTRVPHRPLLADQLVQPVLAHHCRFRSHRRPCRHPSSAVRRRASRGSAPVCRCRRPQHEVQIARLETKYDAPGRAVETRVLSRHLPATAQRPLIERERLREPRTSSSRRARTSPATRNSRRARIRHTSPATPRWPYPPARKRPRPRHHRADPADSSRPLRSAAGGSRVRSLAYLPSPK